VLFATNCYLIALKFCTDYFQKFLTPLYLLLKFVFGFLFSNATFYIRFPSPPNRFLPRQVLYSFSPTTQSLPFNYFTAVVYLSVNQPSPCRL